jgi:hypothetical protein
MEQIQGDAKLYYGMSAYPVLGPYCNVAGILAKNDLVQIRALADKCLTWMAHKAGGYKETMSNGLQVSIHPEGCVMAQGDGWSITFMTPEYLEKLKLVAPPAPTEKFIEFIERTVTHVFIPFVTRPIHLTGLGMSGLVKAS